ncbi:MAG: PEP-CTERM sorting domain-containing protein [Pseudomonadota bacterium]
MKTPRGFLKLLGAVVGLSLFASATTAKADIVVYDNFGPGDTYNGVSGFAINSTFTQGPSFSPSDSGFLTEILLGVGHDGSGPLNLQLTLHADNMGEPGAILETINVVVTVPFGVDNMPTQAVAAGTTILDSSMTYWLIAFNDDAPGTNITWSRNIVGDMGIRALSMNGLAGPWNVQMFDLEMPALRVLVEGQVPEPASVALFIIALGGLGLMIRRRAAPA